MRIAKRGLLTSLLVALAALPLTFSLYTHFAPGGSFGNHEIRIVPVASPTPRAVDIKLEVAPKVFVPRPDVLFDQGWYVSGKNEFRSDSVGRGAITYRGSVGGVLKIHLSTGPEGGVADLEVDGRQVRRLDFTSEKPDSSTEEIRFAARHTGQQFALGAITFLLIFLALSQCLRMLGSAWNGFSRRVKRSIVLGSLVIGFGAIVVGPIPRPALMVADLRIANDAGRNVASAGDELWVRVLGGDGAPKPLSGFWTVGTWKQEPHGWLVASTPNSSLEAIAPMSLDDTIEIYPTAASANAAVSMNGRTTRIDAYATQYEVLERSLRSLTHVGNTTRFVEWSTYAADGIAVALLSAMLLASLWGRRARVRRFDGARETAPVPWWRFAAVPAIAWGYQLLVMWPGLLSSDSSDQWRQLSQQLSNAHPYLLSVGYGVVRELTGTPAVWIALMIIGFSALLGGAASTLHQLGASRRACWAAVAIPALVPPTNLLVLVLWKDVPYSLGLFGITLLLVRILVAQPRADVGPGKLAGLYLFGLLAIASRHNALPTLIIVLAIASLRCWRERKTLLLMTSVLVALVVSSWAINGPIASAADVAPSYTGGAAIAFHVAAHVNAGTTMSSEDQAYLNSLYPLDHGWPYDCTSIGPTWLGLPIDYIKEESHLRAVAVRLALAAPKVELKHIACASRLVWNVNADQERTNRVEFSWRGNDVDYVWSALPAAPQADPPSQQLANRVARFYTAFPNSIQRPALWMYGLLFAAFVVARNRWRLAAVVALVPLAHSAVLAPLNGSQDVRYQLPVIILSAVFTIPMLSIAMRDRPPAAVGSREEQVRS